MRKGEGQGGCGHGRRGSVGVGGGAVWAWEEGQCGRERRGSVGLRLRSRACQRMTNLATFNPSVIQD